MNRYAQLLHGKVIDIREADSVGQLAMIFGPETYWIDVTNIDCEIGYVAKYIEGAGVLYVDPASKIIDKENIIDIEEAKEYKIQELKEKYIKEKEKTRWIILQPQVVENGLIQENEIKYGFDCDKLHTMNFIFSYMNMIASEEDNVDCIVWINENEKGLVNLKKEYLNKVYKEIHYEQLKLSIKFNEKKSEVKDKIKIEDVWKIEWED